MLGLWRAEFEGAGHVGVRNLMKSPVPFEEWEAEHQRVLRGIELGRAHRRCHESGVLFMAAHHEFGRPVEQRNEDGVDLGRVVRFVLRRRVGLLVLARGHEHECNDRQAHSARLTLPA